MLFWALPLTSDSSLQTRLEPRHEAPAFEVEPRHHLSASTGPSGLTFRFCALDLDLKWLKGDPIAVFTWMKHVLRQRENGRPDPFGSEWLEGTLARAGVLQGLNPRSRAVPCAGDKHPVLGRRSAVSCIGTAVIRTPPILVAQV